MANRHKVRLDTDRNCVELTLPSGEKEYYQPSYGSASDLFADLKDAANDDPTTVLEFLKAAAEQMEPADPSIEIDNPDKEEPEPQVESGEGQLWVVHATEDDQAASAVVRAVSADMARRVAIESEFPFVSSAESVDDVQTWEAYTGGDEESFGTAEEYAGLALNGWEILEDWDELDEGVLGKASGLEPDATSGLIGANNNFNLS